jgi:hypothetical protein
MRLDRLWAISSGSTTTPVASPKTSSARTRWLGDARRCVIADVLLLVLAGATVAVCLLDTHGALRLLLLLAAACLIPGGALLTRLPSDGVLEAVGLAVALGFSVEASGALVMIWTGWWHPVAWAAILGSVASMTFAFDLQRSVATLRESS